MSGILRRLKERIHQIHTTSVRTEQMQSEVAQLRAELGDMRGAADGRLDSIQQVVGHTSGVAENTQNLAGEALASTNDARTRSLHQIDLARMALGRLEARQLRLANCHDWLLNEFRVYSQFGEDGLIQLLVHAVGIPRDRQVFVEFGVEDYREANTRFLLMNDRWRGLVLDGDPANIASLRCDPAYLRYNLTAVAAFVTRDNINDLLRENGFIGEIGLLSVDIDGNDFWVWEAIDAVNPILVTVEYNYRFGPDASVVVPYDPAFVKEEAHPSAIYYGASLRALCRLAQRQGYAFVGCSGGGVNAFFVRRDRLPDTLVERTVEEGYVAGHHAEMRAPDGGGFVKGTLDEQQRLLLSLPLAQVDEEGTASAVAVSIKKDNSR